MSPGYLNGEKFTRVSQMMCGTIATTDVAIATHGAGERRNSIRAGWISAASPIAPIIVSTQYFVIRASAPEPDAGAYRAFVECIQIGEHHQRQRDQLQQIRIVLEALQIEDRVD